MRLVPTYASQKDWPRIVAQSINEVIASRGKFGVRSVSATGDIASTDGLVLVDATAGAVTMTLPLAASVPGRVFAVKKVDASGNAVTVDGNGSETIDGATTQALSAQYDVLTVASDGTEWWIQ